MAGTVEIGHAETRVEVRHVVQLDRFGSRPSAREPVRMRAAGWLFFPQRIRPGTVSPSSRSIRSFHPPLSLGKSTAKFGVAANLLSGVQSPRKPRRTRSHSVSRPSTQYNRPPWYAEETATNPYLIRRDRRKCLSRRGLSRIRNARILATQLSACYRVTSNKLKTWRW